MGKKSAAKKKADARGYAGLYIPGVTRDNTKPAVTAPKKAEEPEEASPAAEAAAGDEQQAAGAAAAAPAAEAPAAEEEGDEREDWERLGDEVADDAAPQDESPKVAPEEGGEEREVGEDEEWELAVERRLDEELQKLGKKFIPADATAQLERKGGSTPAGVVVLGKQAEQAMDAALAQLKAEDGYMRMTFPRNWRYKGKLTYERLNSIYLALESLHFKGEQIRWAMERALGYDVRAPMELLLVSLPKEELPRAFGGESLGDDPNVLAEQAGQEPAAPPAPEAAKADEGGGTGEPAKQAQPAPSKVEAASPPAEPAKPAPPQEAPAPASKVDEKGKDFTKSWLMQYCQGGDSDSDELLDEAEKLDRERRKDPTARYLKISKQVDELMRTLKALKEKKKHGSFKQNISADMQKQKEANAKMSGLRTEMEELERGKYGKLDREKVDAALAARRGAQAKEAPPPKPEPVPEKPKEEAKKEDDEDGAELPSLFDGNDAEAAAPEPESAPLPKMRVYNMQGWSGPTPKQGLEDFVRKRVWGKSPQGSVVTYEHHTREGAGRHRAKATVRMPRGQPSQSFDPEEACETQRDSENLAAAWALRKLSEEADRPGLVRSMPPSFKQRWQEWDATAAARLREVQRNLAKGRIAFLEKMLRTKPPEKPFAQAGGTGTEGTAGKVWMESADDVQFVDLGAEATAKIRADYARRQTNLQGNADFEDMQRVRQLLPVADYRESLLRLFQGNSVSVVSGATGSGKTTQVPQYVLEDALEDGATGQLPSIIVTEPRRISAVSVAKRVSQEMGDPPGGPGSRGSLVGYQIRLEKKTCETTRLLFCTVGVLLKQMQQGLGVLSKVTHIFIDEIHERSADCDLLLLLLKRIRGQRPDLRIVLMSATIDVDKLVRYFEGNVPSMSFPGRTFPVETYWLEDMIELTGYYCDDESEFMKRGWQYNWKQQTFQVSALKGKTQNVTAVLEDDDEWAADDAAECCDPARYREETNKTLARLDHTRINFDLIEATLESIENDPPFCKVPRDEGAVLVFLPGLMEITKMHERLQKNPIFGSPMCLVLSLHSVLSGEDHAKAFERPRKGVRKIVLSTNIAETGVTIPDVVFVIDSGKVKSQRYHEPSNTSSLKETFISRAETLQRRGRAGRVREGYAFHLVTQNRFNLRLQVMPTPEILRCSLMELMLSVLSSGLQPACFSDALDPPPKSRIDQAVATLKATGAVEEGPRPLNAPHFGISSDEAWYVTTPIGQCLSRLPCDVRLGKMVLLAALFGGVEAVWTVAATLSHRSPFANPFSDAKRREARVSQCEFLPKDGPPSEHLALHNAYLRWDESRRGRVNESFSRKHWLNNQVMQTIREIRKDFVDSLKSDGFCESFSGQELPAKDAQSGQLAAALIFAGLYPNVARVDAPQAATEKLPVLSAGSEQVRVHPGSLCHGRTEGLHRTNSRWICYHEKVKTSQVFLRDCTFLTPNALLMFGGETSSLAIHPVEKSISLGAGGERHWHIMHVNPRSAALVRQLRYLFEGLLRRKAANPRRPMADEDRAVIRAIVAVIASVELDA